MPDSVYRVIEVVGTSPDSWEGAVRNAVETAVIVSSDGVVRERDLPLAVRPAESPVTSEPGLRADRSFRQAKRAVVHAFERVYLTDLLERHHGNVTGAASRSGMLRSALQRLLRKHGGTIDLVLARRQAGQGVCAVSALYAERGIAAGVGCSRLLLSRAVR